MKTNTWAISIPNERRETVITTDRSMNEKRFYEFLKQEEFQGKLPSGLKIRGIKQ